jgi:hypothetical protein
LKPEYTVELIDLMLMANGKQAIGLLYLLGALQVTIAHADMGMALDLL